MFTIQLVISFFAGGLFIALQTLLGERVPLKWRGAVLTIPSTMALGLLFIGLTKTPGDVTQATIIIPAAMAPGYIFVLAFALLSKLNLAINFIASLTIWAASAFLLINFPPTNFLISLIAYCIPVVIICYLIIKKLPQSTALTPVPMTLKHTAIRSFIGGSIIATIVILSNTLGNIYGGIFSVFPAVYTATFLIYSRVHGKKIIPSVAKSFFMPGIPGFLIYAYIAGTTFPLIGIWLGTLAAYAGTATFYFIYHLAKTSD